MLTSEVKNYINTARNILVGKIPDPKGQIDQITNALVYKFMDDQDKQSESLGGNASFFTGELEKFAWHKLFDSRLDNQKRADLYIEGIEKLSRADNLPELFRDIFKDAFLPFRSADTIVMFLEAINNFDCDHTEELGDAFEYLLSIMGSQGDAWQFRTPRHIIEFIVNVVNPTKESTILDPACGTAGFLVEAYKHIVENEKISPVEQQELANNIVGVDIDPGMAKIARVNLYLHGFKTPQITEDDTLTNETLWKKKKYDIILANPPFMTPKGGIKPHDKFSIKANRAEVLFVDYIAEHLKLAGKAGVIVPEGIIFQSANAYKALRKALVDDKGLYAVVSLPAGVFQPYAGVKTSILFFDRELAKKSDKILFIKVENDGFDLGAQRRATPGQNDLPKALELFEHWREHQEIFEGNEKLAHSVKKLEIAENGEYNLTGERYREVIDYSNVKWEFVKIGDILNSGRGRVISKNYIQENKGDYPVYSSQTTNNGIFGRIKTYDFNGEYLTWTTDGANAGKVFYRNGKFNCTNVCGTLKLKDKLDKEVNLAYIAPILDIVTENFVVKVGNPKLMNKEIERIKIPLPPLEIQEKIVAEIDGYQKIIDGAKQVVKNWKPSFKVDSDWDMVELGEVCEFNPKKAEVKNLDQKMLVSFVPMADLNEHQIDFEVNAKKTLKDAYSGYTYFAENDVLLAKVTPCFENGKSGIAKNLENKIGFGSSEYFVYRANLEKILPEFIYYFISSSEFLKQGKNNMSGTGGLQRLIKDFAIKFKIPLPSLKIQEKIVAEIETEQEIVEANKKLIEIYEGKIEVKIGEVWGEEN